MQAIPATTFRADILSLGFGVLFFAIGLLGLTIRLLRRRGDWSLLFFGIAAALYGFRLLVTSRSAHLAFNDVVLDRISWTITFVIGIPFVLYFASHVKPAWRKVVWITIALQISLALFGIPAAFTGRGLELAKLLNNYLVVGFMPVLVGLVLVGQRKLDRNMMVLRVGAMVLAGFSIYTNLVGLGFFRGSERLEFIGFVVFLGTLGYASANRFVHTEERLVAIQSELEIARRIQSDLLPGSEFSAPQLEISAKYVPLSSVAGDFYDFIKDGSGTGVLISDVTGHGVPAALTASMVKVAIRAQSDHVENPSKVLEGLNNILHGNLQGQFVTAAYVYVDPQARKLAYSGAGHPPLLIWRAAQEKVETLESNGLFLGPFPTVDYPTLETSFEPGDRCVLYTDGVIEAETPAGDPFGNDRLANYLAENASVPGPAFCDGLLRRIQQWSQRGPDAEQNDDITFLTIDCK